MAAGESWPSRSTPPAPSRCSGKPNALFADVYDFGQGLSIANYDVNRDGRSIAYLEARREGDNLSGGYRRRERRPTVMPIGAGDPVAVADEARRADVLRRSVDVACALLRQARLTREEAEAVVAATRARALELFPGKQGVFDLVLAPRFVRILDEFCAPRSAKIRPTLRHRERR